LVHNNLRSGIANNQEMILVEDIPLCLSTILKRNKIYTSSNTTILYFINLIKYKIVVFDEVYILCHLTLKTLN